MSTKPNKRPARAFFLAEMLVVLFLVLVGGGLITTGLSAILRSQKQVARLSNRYTVLHDMLSHLRADVRHADSLTIQQDDDTPIAYELVLLSGASSPAGAAPRRVWRFAGGRVERVASITAPEAEKVWDLGPCDTTLAPGPGDPTTLLDLSVTWRTDRVKDMPSRRRFDATIRCAGELDDEAQ